MLVKSVNRRTTIIIFSLILVALLGVAGIAKMNYRDDISLQLSGYIERDGQKINLDKSVVAKQGEILHYTITAKNAGDAVNHFQTSGMVPNGTILVRESIKTDSQVTYSIDNGKSFSANPMIVNAKGEKENAPVAAYNAVAFTFKDGFTGEKSVTYDVKVK